MAPRLGLNDVAPKLHPISHMAPNLKKSYFILSLTFKVDPFLLAHLK
jgi:hypothetical protein